MTREEILTNFLNIEQPTVKQIIETLKILIKQDLKITDDLYTINSLTGAKIKKISTVPKQVDLMTDEKIITGIAKTEAEKVRTLLSSEMTNKITTEITKQLSTTTKIL